MVRVWVVATLVVASFVDVCGLRQELGVLHIKVVLVDAAQNGDAGAAPRAAHQRQSGDASPRRVVTAPDGTADVRLRPGNYTVESDKPVAFEGKAYQWTQTVDIAAGRDASSS